MQSIYAHHRRFSKRLLARRGSILALLLLVVVVPSGSQAARSGDDRPFVFRLPFGPQLVEHMRGIGNYVYFSAFQLKSGLELWRSDGTAAGTALVKDIHSGEEWSRPYDLVPFRGMLYFVADDGVHGRELWRSDGTAAGTVMVKDINPGSASALQGIQSDDKDQYRARLTASGNYLFFVAADRADHEQLWRSDGTAAGTVPVPAFDSTGAANLTDVNGTLFFVARDSLRGAELWKTDGTAAGTTLVKTIAPGPEARDATQFMNVGGTLFFSVYTSSTGSFSGRRLWKSDGTAAGTVPVLNPDEPVDPAMITNVNGTLLFAGYDPMHGRELWRSNGTAAGTTLVKDIFPGSGDALAGIDSVPRPTGTLGDTLFFVADDGARRALWRSDGTAAGTASLDIDMAFGRIGLSSYLQEFVACNGALFFTRMWSTQLEVWRSDGTIKNTVLLKQFPEPNYDTSQKQPGPTMACAQNTLFFAAGTPNNRMAAQNLWRSDGTAAGTALVQPEQSVFLPLMRRAAR